MRAAGGGEGGEGSGGSPPLPSRSSSSLPACLLQQQQRGWQEGREEEMKAVVALLLQPWAELAAAGCVGEKAGGGATGLQLVSSGLAPPRPWGYWCFWCVVVLAFHDGVGGLVGWQAVLLARSELLVMVGR